MSNVNTANTIIATDKRRLDGDLRGIQQELDDLMNQIKNSEEKTKKALSDAGKYGTYLVPPYRLKYRPNLE